MQNKGLIRTLSIVLAVVCLFQLSYTWMVKSVESDAKSFAKGNPDLETRYLDSMKNEKIFPPLINFYTYKECKNRELNLGLDLKGGMNVTLELSTADVIKGLANHSSDKDFNTALENAIKRQENSQENLVRLFGEEFAKINPNNKLAAIFSTADLQSKINYKSTNEEVLTVIQNEVNDAIKRSYNIIRTRIDKFGVTQPNVQQLANDRIMVELPGVKEKERVRKLLQGTAQLEFWPTYNFGEVVGQLVEINKTLVTINTRDSLAKALAPGNPEKPSSPDTAIVAKDTTNAGVDSLLGQIKSKSATDSASTDSTGKNKQMSQEEFKREYPLFSLLTPSDYLVKTQEDQEFVYASPRIGFALLSDTGKVNALLSKPEVKGLLKNDLRFAWTAKSSNPTNDNVRELIALKVTGRDGRATLDGSHVSDARGDRSTVNNEPEVNMQMNAEGAAIWKRMTTDNKGRCIAIVLDEFVYSYPKVNDVIPNGSSQISGNFTDADAADLANILKAGKLPAPCHIIEESVVGPTLGEKAIRDGLISFVIALLVVMAFMVFYYSTAGWVADLALFTNLLFLFGVLTAFNAVLTMPGIAGIVLTLGMAVDANVLIYERIREELRAGKGVRLAINDGYRMAYSAIIDSNVLTIITGIILYTYGTGPIQGFATTLIIGILTSLFASIFISRLIFEWMLSKNKVIHFSTKTTENILRNTKFDFISMRKKSYIISSIALIISLASIIFSGFNKGVDFQGGRSYRVQFETPKNAEDIRASLSEVFGKGTEVKTLENDKTFKITTAFMISSRDAEADNIVEKKLMDGLKIHKDQIIWSQKVGPTVADDIKQEALMALIFGGLAIFFYIVVRFRKWTFGAGALIALAHDTLIILGVFSIFKNVMPFSLDLDQAFIAALLSVMGYSISDTVVVFDRIREYLGVHKKGEIKTIINNALNDTLSRTINTSLTIFFVLTSIFIFGGETIRGFSFALLLGIIVGTYSSIFIATPIVIDFDRKERELKK